MSSSTYRSIRSVFLCFVVSVALVPLVLLLPDGAVTALSPPPALMKHDHQQQHHPPDVSQQQQRRALFQSGVSFLVASSTTAAVAAVILAQPSVAHAATDCYQDCLKNCRLAAPQDTSGYCTENCRDYCDQPDREDGLSGSVSSEKGETGILGFYTVPKGADKPPVINLPGLDFTSGAGKKLIGY
jgi:hypothetical protein